jgi:hypothetical protein
MNDIPTSIMSMSVIALVVVVVPVAMGIHIDSGGFRIGIYISILFFFTIIRSFIWNCIRIIIVVTVLVHGFRNHILLDSECALGNLWSHFIS